MQNFGSDFVKNHVILQTFVKSTFFDLFSMKINTKKLLLLAMTGLGIITGGCHKQQVPEEAKTPAKEVSGISKDNMDLSANPSEDFYQYACGGWMANNPLPNAYSRYGSFDQLAESTEKQLHKLISEIAQKSNAAGTNEQKIADLYNSGMDETAIEEFGVTPIKFLLDKISSLQDRKQLTDVITLLHDYGFSPFFSLSCQASPNNSSLNIAWINQSGLGLRNEDLYLNPIEKIKKGYTEMLQQFLEFSEYADNAHATALAEKVWKLESSLARIYMDKNDMRDPDLTNHVMTADEAAALTSTFNFSSYLTAAVPSGIDQLNVTSPAYISKMDGLLKTTDLETIKAYLATQVICQTAPYMSKKFVDAHFTFFGKIRSGKTENKERWQRVIGTISDMLGEPVGQLYVKQYFPQEAKDRMLHLVSNLKAALGDRIAKCDWMSRETQQKAQEKLEAINVKIGYPDKWRDYSSLNIDKSGYLSNILKIWQFETDYELAKIGKPVDPTTWYMSPQTVNAYYEPPTNEICFPAAILQPPFFDLNADMAANYGAIGVVIGHEMTHAFDDQGRKYDKDGNVNNWWTEEDAKKFADRTQVLVDHFNAIEVLPGQFANGKFTLGENIADNGGLNTSYDALQRAKAEGDIKEVMDGFTADQRFFLAYAAVWANNITEQEIERRLTDDEHSLGKWRVNGALPHIDAFIKAFNIKEGDPMYLAPEKRAKIW